MKLSLRRASGITPESKERYDTAVEELNLFLATITSLHAEVSDLRGSVQKLTGRLS